MTLLLLLMLIPDSFMRKEIPFRDSQTVIQDTDNLLFVFTYGFITLENIYKIRILCVLSIFLYLYENTCKYLTLRS